MMLVVTGRVTPQAVARVVMETHGRSGVTDMDHVATLLDEAGLPTDAHNIVGFTAEWRRLGGRPPLAPLEGGA